MAFITQLQQGEYLAKIGNCITCHTDNKAGAEAFSGGLRINTPFGEIPSTNITPDPKTGIGLWSSNDFIKAMRTGVSPSGKNYYPAFPYLYFSNLTDNDLKSLYLYFKSIPPVYKENESPQFPLNIWGARSLMSIWNIFGFTRKPNLLPKSEPIQAQIGAYIVNGLGHCGMCHTTHNWFGLPRSKLYLSGAFIGGFWAPNITKEGLKGSKENDVVDVFKHRQLMNNAGPLAGPMADVSQNSLKYLLPQDARAIATYLMQVKSKPLLYISPKRDETAPLDFDRGQVVYMQVCSVCHQSGLASAPKMGQSATWFNRVNTAGVELLYQRTINGFNNMPKLGGCVYCTKNDVISAVNFLLYQSLTTSQIRHVKGIRLK